MWSPYKINELINITQMYSLFESNYGKDVIFDGEAHNFWECVYVIDGTLIVSGDERVYNLSKGDIIFHKPLEFHKFRIESVKGVRLFIFSFSADGVISDFFKNKVFHLSTEQNNIIKKLLNYLRKKNDDMNTDKQIIISYISKIKTEKTFSQTVVTHIYQLLLSLYDENEISNVSDTPEAHIYKTAVKYMQENISSSLSVEEISKHCNVSQTGLKRIFNKFSGLGVHKYFLTLKINSAVKLLNNKVSVTEISEKLGFSNQGYFSYVFKRETGKSPTEYFK